MDRLPAIVNEVYYRRAAELRPEMVSERVHHGESLGQLGLCLMELGRGDEAEKTYREAIGVLEAVHRVGGEGAGAATHLGGAYCNLANLLTRRGADANVSLGWFTRAVEVLGSSTDGSSVRRQYLGNSLSGRANVLAESRRFAEAVADLDRAVELGSDPAERNGKRGLRAVCRAHLGQTDGAAEDATAVAATAGIDEVSLYNAACAWSLSSAAVKNKGTLPDDYARAAVRVLVRLKDAGYFTAARAEQLDADADLKPLHDRSDYKDFRRGLKPAKP